MLRGPVLTSVVCVVLGAAVADWASAQEPLIERLPPIDFVTPPETVLPPPNEESVELLEVELSEYEWYDANYWFPAVAWKGSFELGLNGSAGNSQTLSFRTGASLKRVSDGNEFLIDLKYVRKSANFIETQHNAMLNFDYDRQFQDSPWTMFARYGLLYDEFKAFDLRWNVNMGIGRKLIEWETTSFTSRFGAGASREIGGPDDGYKPEAVFGLDFKHQLTERQKLVAKVDYFPQWNDFRDYRLVSDFGLEILLDEEANLNLKLGVIDRYDSTPNGRRPNDFDYSLVLLWTL